MSNTNIKVLIFGLIFLILGAGVGFLYKTLQVSPQTKKTEKHLVEKREAVARGKDLRISTKQAVDITRGNMDCDNASISDFDKFEDRFIIFA